MVRKNKMIREEEVGMKKQKKRTEDEMKGRNKEVIVGSCDERAKRCEKVTARMKENCDARDYH